MRKLSKSKIIRNMRVAAIGLVTLVAYQNCSPFQPLAASWGPLASFSTSNGPMVYQSTTIRRLSNVELTNSIQDVFMGGSVLTGSPLPLQRVRNGFDNQIASLDVNTPFMTTLQQVAEQTSAYVIGNLATLVTCDRTQTSCIQTYITHTGRRAFRRPLTTDEVSNYVTLYNQRVSTDGAGMALAAVVEAMIQSPYFLYRTELGTSAAGTVVMLTAYETAAALSYFVLASAPDDILLDAAAAGQLATPGQRAAQIRRLLQAPGAHQGLANFMMQWAQVLDAATLTGSFGTQYPAFTADVANAAWTETQMFFDKELFSGAANWKNLFTSTTSYVNPSLAAIYGVTVNGAGFAAVQENAAQRSGFLTHTSFLASRSDGGGFSPVHFGLYVATQLFCNSIPQPPANVPALAPDPTGSISPRQRFANHLTVAVCNSCHSAFDPMGWGFETYNPLGQYQTSFGSYSVTGAGSLVGTDVNADFTGAPQMAAKIVQSRQAQTCFTRKLYEYALGRTDLDNNQDSTIYNAGVAGSAESFAVDTNILNLMVSVGQSDAFVMRDAGSAQ